MKRAWLCVFFAVVACTKKSEAPTAASIEASSEEKAARLVDRGRKSYAINCITCHNPDPSKDGSVGPAVSGASSELLNKRILEGTYPTGYKPKRSTLAMPKLEHLKSDIEALHAFLN